jgi:Na+/H+ antiporter NhaC
MQHQGILCLIPTLVVLILSIWSKRTFESLVAACVAGLLLLDGWGFFGGLTDALSKVMQDPTIGWVILVCGLFGSLIHLVVKAGGAQVFGEYVIRWVTSRRAALMTTWLMGIVIFIDDYLNALVVGSSMKKVTDKFGVSREMLAYIVDSTAAPVCVLIPLSTWAVYVAGLLESTGVATQGEGLQAYIQTIPYIGYGWAAVLLVPLVAMGWIPALGTMRAAERRAAGGQPAPPDSTVMGLSEDLTVKNPHPRLEHFAVPILVLLVATIALQADALKGVIIAVVFTVIYFEARKVTHWRDAVDDIFDGFKTMLFPLALIVMSFVLKEVNDRLGLTQYVIEKVSPWMDRRLLPVITFLALGTIAFTTASLWGMYAIALPIVVPLAQQLGVDTWLATGAVISAGAFGSHACFYSDATILASAACGCNNIQHALTQLPYVLVAAALAAAMFLAMGFSS